MNQTLTDLVVTVSGGIITLFIEYGIILKYFNLSPGQVQQPTDHQSTVNSWRTPRILQQILILVVGVLTISFVTRSDLGLPGLTVATAVFSVLLYLAVRIMWCTQDNTTTTTALAGIGVGLLVTWICITGRFDVWISSLPGVKSLFFTVGISLSFLFIPIILLSLSSPKVSFVTGGLTAISLISLYGLFSSHGTQDIFVWWSWGVLFGLLLCIMSFPDMFKDLLDKLDLDNETN